MAQGRVVFTCCSPAGSNGRIPGQKAVCKSQWQAVGGVYTDSSKHDRMSLCLRGHHLHQRLGTLGASRVRLGCDENECTFDETGVVKVTLVDVDCPALSSLQDSCYRKNDGHLVTAALNASMRCINARKSCSRPCMKQSRCSTKQHCSRKGYSYTQKEMLFKRGETYEQKSLNNSRCGGCGSSGATSCCTACGMKETNIVRRNNTPFRTVAGVNSNLYIADTKVNAQLQAAKNLSNRLPSKAALTLPTRLNSFGTSRTAPSDSLNTNETMQRCCP